MKEPFDKKWRRIKRFMPLYLIFLPIAAYFLIFQYVPLGGMIIAFKDYKLHQGIIGSEWAGLAHFEKFLSNGDFWDVLVNTVLLALYRTLFGFPAPILFALLIYELRFQKIKKFFQTASYLPHFVSWVVVYGVMYNFFSMEGLINQVRRFFGQDAILFMGMPEYFRTLFVGSAIWKEVGWGAIIYLAALTRVDPSLHEAAAIDGANRLRRIWHITLPAIRPIASIMFVLGMGNILSVSFEQVLVMHNPQVAAVSEVIDYYVYRVGLLNVNNYSYAAAVGFFRAIIGLCLVLMANWFAKKLDEDGGIW